MNARNALRLGAGLLFASLALTSSGQALRTVTGFSNTDFPANDDGVLQNVGIGFGINFFGNSYTQLSLSNNGNVQFNGADDTFTPFNLTGPTGNPIIAPFFADVDTRAPGSNPTRYGMGTVGGHNVFAVNWIDVGVYFEQPIFNTFQLLIIDRSDVAAGDFDFEFNYDKINWETGTASGADPGGLGGNSARAGFNSGTGQFFELPGSAVNGAFLDSNLVTGLIHNQMGMPFDGANVNGRYDFQVRQGGVVGLNAVPEPSTYGLVGSAVLCGLVALRRRRRANQSA